MTAEVREIFSGERLNSGDNDVDRIIDKIVSARGDAENSFSIAGKCFLIYSYKDKDGVTQYGEFNSGMLASEMLWMIEKVKLGMLEE